MDSERQRLMDERAALAQSVLVKRTRVSPPYINTAEHRADRDRYKVLVDKIGQTDSKLKTASNTPLNDQALELKGSSSSNTNTLAQVITGLASPPAELVKSPIVPELKMLSSSNTKLAEMVSGLVSRPAQLVKPRRTCPFVSSTRILDDRYYRPGVQQGSEIQDVADSVAGRTILSCKSDGQTITIDSKEQAGVSRYSIQACGPFPGIQGNAYMLDRGQGRLVWCDATDKLLTGSPPSATVGQTILRLLHVGAGYCGLELANGMIGWARGDPDDETDTSPGMFEMEAIVAPTRTHKRKTEKTSDAVSKRAKADEADRKTKPPQSGKRWNDDAKWKATVDQLATQQLTKSKANLKRVDYTSVAIIDSGFFCTGDIVEYRGYPNCLMRGKIIAFRSVFVCLDLDEIRDFNTGEMLYAAGTKWRLRASVLYNMSFREHGRW